MNHEDALLALAQINPAHIRSALLPENRDKLDLLIYLDSMDPELRELILKLAEEAHRTAAAEVAASPEEPEAPTALGQGTEEHPPTPERVSRGEYRPRTPPSEFRPRVDGMGNAAVRVLIDMIRNPAERNGAGFPYIAQDEFCARFREMYPALNGNIPTKFKQVRLACARHRSTDFKQVMIPDSYGRLALVYIGGRIPRFNPIRDALRIVQQRKSEPRRI